MKIFVIGGPTVTEDDATYAEQYKLLRETMTAIGRETAIRGHTLVACSPFEGSADFHAIKGAASAGALATAPVDLHYPSGPTIVAAVTELKHTTASLRIAPFAHPPPPNEDDKEGRKHAWPLAQLAALESSQVTIALGGKSNGPMSFLLPLAESRRKKILPLAFLGGAAALCFERQRYVLSDRLGAAIQNLSDPSAVNQIMDHVNDLFDTAARNADRTQLRKYFISYPRARPAEADFIETILRRRQCEVFRDERDFGVGQNILQEINSSIESADVFIAVWCQEYACSPWCFDELELALKRQKHNLNIWLFCVDDTRIVPPEARDLLSHRLRSREEIEGQILKLLEG